jgi:hypothetical protein
MREDWKKDSRDERTPIEVPDFLHHPLRDADEPDVVGELSVPVHGNVVEEQADRPAAQPRSDQPGLYLYGVVRARAGRSITRANREIQRVRYRDIEALVRNTMFELPAAEGEGVKQHQEVVEMMMRRVTILPVPYGIVFKGRRPLVKLLQDQYLVFDEGLSLLDGHWELRLHISAQASDKTADMLSDESMEIYSELRRYSRAAVTFANGPERLLSAAFLVDRTSWVEFIERVEDFQFHHSGLAFDVTGPWPAYDFVRVVT